MGVPLGEIFIELIQEGIVMKHWIRVGSLGLAALLILPAPTCARPPLFHLDPLPDQTVQATTRFEYQVTYHVEDPACWMDAISFGQLSAPSGMTITKGGKIQ